MGPVAKLKDIKGPTELKKLTKFDLMVCHLAKPTWALKGRTLYENFYENNK